MSKLKILWATVKGWICPGTSAFEEIMKIALDKVNGALAPASDKIGKACSVISSALAIIDKYADWCPAKWRADFDRVRSVVAQLVNILEDSTLTPAEVSTIADVFRIEYAKWFAD